MLAPVIDEFTRKPHSYEEVKSFIINRYGAPVQGLMRYYYDWIILGDLNKLSVRRVMRAHFQELENYQALENVEGYLKALINDGLVKWEGHIPVPTPTLWFFINELSD